MSFLVLDRLTKRYGDHTVVDALSLDVDRGEERVPPGSVRLRQDDDAADDRRLRRADLRRDPLDGRDLVAMKPTKRGLGIVFQSYALFPHMTAAENVAFGLEMQGVGRAERDQRVGDTLDLVGLSGFPAAFRAACPAASNSAWRWPVRS